ncbi:MAG TPA: hypothetical protein PLD38_03285 [Pyrinomonadaceae bacterium]|nr:hypothetical protein [Chloracidobacterium sp.]HQY66282.1 hypothetical protein [Pyrinomonadaceae bacterium]HRA39065.1 hypothetical protein [Pyrinomonadaceae bacterium]
MKLTALIIACAFVGVNARIVMNRDRCTTIPLAQSIATASAFRLAFVDEK